MQQVGCHRGPLHKTGGSPRSRESSCANVWQRAHGSAARLPLRARAAPNRNDSRTLGFFGNGPVAIGPRCYVTKKDRHRLARGLETIERASDRVVPQASTQLKEVATNSAGTPPQCKEAAANSSEASIQFKEAATNSSEASDQSMTALSQRSAA